MKILLVTHSLQGIPQRLHETESLDLGMMEGFLEDAGFNVLVVSHRILMAMNPDEIKNRIILYASSQYPEFFNYIEDCLLYAESCGGKLVPNFKMFRSHENKFFQELVKKELKLDLPKARLVGTMDDLTSCISELNFPLVLKTSSGFGSKGVFRINSADELVETAESVLQPIIPPDSNLLYRVKHRRSRESLIERYREKYPFYVGRIILQEFLEGLTHDWKVLVFGGKCFCLKRYVRTDDFRASGSGKFTFDDDPSDELLDFAVHVVKKLDTPWASLDIAELSQGFGLIEYQCVHFGLYTLMRNSRYFVKQGMKWVPHVVKDPNPEEHFCKALVEYLDRP
jgi:glutathione synthase/RimK-type ligase-like ATP-grasp enzyme